MLMILSQVKWYELDYKTKTVNIIILELMRQWIIVDNIISKS